MAAPKGHPKYGGGRAKGTPNKINAALKDMILGALSQAGGQEYLVEQAQKHPVAFLALLGRVLPMQVTGENGGPVKMALEWMTEEEAKRRGWL